MANEGLDKAVSGEYQLGFEIDIETDIIKPGLDESTIAFISKKKEEPEWMLELRLKALKKWETMTEPHWAHLEYEPIDYQSISYFAAPKQAPDSLDEVDPKIIEAYEKLGIPIEEQKQLQGIAVDVVVDSVSVTTTYSEELKKHGVIFCSISDAIRDYPELVKKYMFSVVPMADNYFAALNSAVFTDGTFVYIPKGVRCPMELSTYFRINALNTGQFERT
ncbi:MAG: Fe-S cluster assembly protein SufB, partial [Campylobacterota bacterium]|nr:Fe-S cluster assembly protein SufB [Campylobacterota bacterium]